MNLNARGRLPVHHSVQQRELAAVQEAFFDGVNLHSVEEFRDDYDFPFFLY